MKIHIKKKKKQAKFRYLIKIESKTILPTEQKVEMCPKNPGYFKWIKTQRRARLEAPE